MMKNNYIIVNGELYHYGILGMKWGKRKAHPDHKEAHNGKKLKEMSNDELRKRNNRLQMEEQHRELKRKSNVGRRVVAGVIAASATIVALDKASGVFSKYGKKALEAMGNYVVKGINLSGKLTS